MPHTEPLPRLAAQLGYAGLIPFVIGAMLAWLPELMPFVLPHWPLLAYGAVILSFMGAIHWGLAMHSGQMTNGTRNQLLLSIVPSLIAWIALALPPIAGYPVLGMGFLLMLFGDVKAVAYGQAPDWYPGLRGPLTFVALISLAVAWAGTVLVVGGMLWGWATQSPWPSVMWRSCAAAYGAGLLLRSSAA